MEVLSGENLKTRLIVLVGDTIPHSGAEHHLRALHEVVHHIL